MIDRATIDRIYSAAKIEEVVGDFVTLRRSGSNYKGLCPFHDERAPSFMVNPARNICHCFGCGKGGNPVNFIMEHEQMTYPEALRWLAKKYHIEIQEKELTEEEKQQQTDRESMFVINEWTAAHFENTLHHDVDGMAIGMQYFRQRGIRDDIVRKFRLGYALNDRYELSKNAKQEGYSDKYLTMTGTCYQREQDNAVVNRFAGRVIFPWLGVSGKVVAFGGRLLDARTKGVQQKYVNSPDSEIFHKDHELYGIFQAKRAISKEDQVYMVEGYTDVIAMHQCGIENVVANSGTALSVYQIRMLHRFTQNITLLYDGDGAGIHAAMRGIDMLLAEGMNIKVLLLPDGDDPDSFSRKHTAEEFRTYITENQEDFVRFKTRLLLNGVTDPFKRSEAIGSIVQSIAVIPNPILRDTYIHDCASTIGMSEQTLISQMNKLISNRKQAAQKQQQQAPEPAPSEPAEMQQQPQSAVQKSTPTPLIEKDLLGMVLLYGERMVFHGIQMSDGTTTDLAICEYIYFNLQSDGLTLQDPLYMKVMEEAVEHCRESNFVAENYFTQHTDYELSRLAQQLTAQQYAISTKQQMTKSDEQLRVDVERLIGDFRLQYIETRMKQIMESIRTPGATPEQLNSLMTEYRDMQQIRKALALQIGKNLVN